MEKLTRIEMRKMRVRILSEINRLNEARCDLCTDEIEGNSSGNRTNCDCAAAVKVRKLGEKLSKLVSNRKKTETESAPKVEVKKVFKPKLVKFENMTVDHYKNFKKNKMTDIQMMKHFGIGNRKFNKWKEENGLMTVTTKGDKRLG